MNWQAITAICAVLTILGAIHTFVVLALIRSEIRKLNGTYLRSDLAAAEFHRINEHFAWLQGSLKQKAPLILGLLLLLLPGSAAAQTTLNLHITGQVQSTSTTKRNFGRLPRGYRAADWTVTNESAQPAKVSLARLLQEIHTGPGVSILSGVSATSVVEDAQASNPLNSTARVGTGVLAGLATCEGLKICPAGGSWSTVILGAEVATLALQYVFPTLSTHALQSITAMMPATLALDGFGTVSGMVIVEIAKKTPDPPALDLTITIPYSVLAAGAH